MLNDPITPSGSHRRAAAEAAGLRAAKEIEDADITDEQGSSDGEIRAAPPDDDEATPAGFINFITKVGVGLIAAVFTLERTLQSGMRVINNGLLKDMSSKERWKMRFSDGPWLLFHAGTIIMVASCAEALGAAGWVWDWGLQTSSVPAVGFGLIVGAWCWGFAHSALRVSDNTE